MSAAKPSPLKGTATQIQIDGVVWPDAAAVAFITCTIGFNPAPKPDKRILMFELTSPPTDQLESERKDILQRVERRSGPMAAFVLGESLLCAMQQQVGGHDLLLAQELFLRNFLACNQSRRFR